MKITIENIAAIRKAEINLNKISVIVGYNNTGKSTIGKTLFAFVKAIGNLPDKIVETQISQILHFTRRIIESNITLDEYNDRAYSQYRKKIYPILSSFREIIAPVIENGSCKDINQAKTIVASALGKINKDFSFCTEDKIPVLLEQVAEMMNKIINDTDIKFAKNRLSRFLSNIFNGQVSPLMEQNAKGRIILDIDGKYIIADVCNDECARFKQESTLPVNVIGIDNIEQDLKDNLEQHIEIKQSENWLNEDSLNENRKKLLDILSDEIPGFFELKRGDLMYNNRSFSLNVKNLSDGMKSLCILKTLIETNLNEGDIVVLDEPEVHLHTAWQLKYAELIVLIQKELNVTILLATHSPFFVEAISKYAKLYNVIDGVSYYMSKKMAENAMYEIVDINDDLDKVFEQMLSPMSALKELRTMD